LLNDRYTYSLLFWVFKKKNLKPLKETPPFACISTRLTDLYSSLPLFPGIFLFLWAQCLHVTRDPILFHLLEKFILPSLPFSYILSFDPSHQHLNMPSSFPLKNKTMISHPFLQPTYACLMLYSQTYQKVLCVTPSVSAHPVCFSTPSLWLPFS
jgi:hypothetical protein